MYKSLCFVSLIAFAATPALSGRPTDTVGYCVSDGFYGNEPNIEDPYAAGGPSNQDPGTLGGRVVPSQSPGPFVNNPTDPDNPTKGSSLGDYHEFLARGGLLDGCEG